MPFKCSLAVLPQDFVGWFAPHRGPFTPHNKTRTLLLPASRIHRHHAGWGNKLNYITCFHIYIIAYFFSFVKSKECKGPWRISPGGKAPGVNRCLRRVFLSLVYF